MKIYFLFLFITITLNGATMKHKGNHAAIVDFETNLMWQDTNATITNTLTWIEASEYCSGLIHMDINGWRLPDYDELLHITNYNLLYRYGDTTESLYDEFRFKKNSFYWSINTYVSNDDMAWIVKFPLKMEDHTSLKVEKHFVRCVRNIF